MKVDIIKKSNLKKIKKDLNNLPDNKKNLFSAVIKLFEIFDDKIILIKVYEGNDIDLKIRMENNEYKYVKILHSINDKFGIMNLDMHDRKIGKDNLYNMINNDINYENKLSKETKNEILKYIDFNRNRKKLLYILIDNDNNYYIMKEQTIKDIILKDVEYMYKKDSTYKIYNGNIPVNFINDYWKSYLKAKKKSEIDVWKFVMKA